MENNKELEYKSFWSKYGRLIIGLLILLVAITSIFIMITFTKNTSSMYGTDTAKTATFSYTIKQTEEENQTLSSTGGTIDIFGTTEDDAGVASPTDDTKLLAPGMEGYFEFEIDNSSQTAVMVEFDDLQYNDQSDTASGNKIPLIFYFNGKYYSDMHDHNIGKGNGSDYTYYFHEGDAQNSRNGITLSGDMNALKTALNSFSSMDSEKNAAIFLDNGTKSYLRMAWFWPYEALYQNTETGESTGAGYKVYSFDDYNAHFISSPGTVSMAPLIRTTQLSTYSTPTTQGTNYGFDTSKWHGSDTPQWEV